MPQLTTSDEFERVRARVERVVRSRLRDGTTLDAVAVVSEVWLRLRQHGCPYESTAHHFAVACKAFRDVVSNHHREQGRLKRGGGAVHVTLDVQAIARPLLLDEAVDVGRALDALARLTPETAHVVEMQWFGGLSIEETAEALGLSVATVSRKRAAGLAFLRRFLSERESAGEAEPPS